jgi:DNA-directed RNA polymerase beta' subunit
MPKKSQKGEEKRPLTKSEIKDILSSFIVPNPYLPLEIAEDISTRDYDKYESQLKKMVVYPSIIPHLKMELKKHYSDSQIQAGECVGIITAQSIGQKQTQANLNNFHKAGSSEKQPVTSKFSELLNATKEPKAPTCIAHFTQGNSSIQELRNTMGSSVVQITFQKITNTYEIFIDKEQEPWYKPWCILNDIRLDDRYKSCIRLYLNMDILYTYKVRLQQIADYISANYCDMVCVPAPDNFGFVDIFIDTSQLQDEELKADPREIYIDDVVYPSLMNIVICGIPGVENIYFLREHGKWYLEIENTCIKLPDSITRFKKILALDFIDSNRTTSNNIWVIYHTFGIEATREHMIREFSCIMEGINISHIALLVDKMTHGGTISSISRYSMRQEESGPFGKASFEETMDNFRDAGAVGQEESTKEVSAGIICGKRIGVGTGLCSIKYDIDALLS